MSMEEIFGEVIYAYTRKQAIEDGVIIPVDDIAPGIGGQLGFKYPIAITSAVCDLLVVPDGLADIQDARGILWDMLFRLYLAIKTGRGQGDTINFSLMKQVSRRGKQMVYRLKSVVTGGDEGEPVITIMLPHED